MADFNKLAQQMVTPVFEPMEQNLNTQVTEAQNDPYFKSLLSGLDAAKNRSFAEIEGRAAGRGVAYGNIPSQQQGAYLGEKYLPAVAEVKKTQLERINALKQTLAELRSKRASAVLDQYNIYEDRDWKTKEAEKERAWKASQAALDRASSGGWSTSGGGSGGSWVSGGGSGDSNGDGVLSAAEATKMMLHSGRSWADIARSVELEYPGSTKSGGDIDKMLRGYFIGPETKYVPQAAPAPARRTQASSSANSAAIRNGLLRWLGSNSGRSIWR